jgi:hypothetical protein
MTYLYLDRAGRIDELGARLGGAGLELSSELQKLAQAKDAELSNKEVQLRAADDAIAKLELEVAAANQREGDARTARDAAVNDAGTKQNQINTLEGQLSGIREERNSLSTRITNLEQDFRNLETENLTLKEELARANLEGSDKAKVAAAFDTLAALVERGQGEIAQASLGDFEKKAVFGAATGRLQPFLRALVDASAHVEKHLASVGKGAGPRLGEIRSSESLLVAAEREYTALEVDHGDWRQVEFGGQAQPDRILRARAVLDALKGQVQGELVASVSEDAGAWKGLVLARLGADPQPIFDHFDRYGCREHLSLGAKSLVDDLNRNAGGGSTLDAAALRNVRELARWVALLDSKQFELSAREAQDLRLYEFAQRWYGNAAAAAIPPWTFAPPPTPTAPTSDWRQIMYLQWRLAQEDANLPIKKGRTQLYRLLEPGKTPGWGKSIGRSDSRFSVETLTFDEKGYQKGTASRTEFEFVDGELRVRGSDVTIVDLHAQGEGLSVVPFPEIPDSVAVPSSLATDTELKKFREFVRSRNLACLAVQSSGRTRWLSPEFGLVIDDNVGILRRELVSATGVQ